MGDCELLAVPLAPVSFNHPDHVDLPLSQLQSFPNLGCRAPRKGRPPSEFRNRNYFVACYNNMKTISTFEVEEPRGRPAREMSTKPRPMR